VSRGQSGGPGLCPSAPHRSLAARGCGPVKGYGYSRVANNEITRRTPCPTRRPRP
jgi:hypothetical protein